MLPHPINLAIVDDHTLFRKALKHYLSGQINLKVIVESPDIPDLLTKLKYAHIHVLLMDVFMPRLSGLEAVKIIKNEYPDIKILILSMCTDMDLLSDLLDAGVYGIISKVDEPEELIRSVLSISDQRLYRSKLLTEVMYWNKQNMIMRPAGTGGISLNERERIILQLLWEEKSNKEIAREIFLSVRSVEKIRQDMKEKLGVKSTIGLLKYGISMNIINNNMVHNRI